MVGVPMMRRSQTALFTGVLIACTVLPGRSESRPNPYVSVVERNPFQLKPTPLVEPPAPPAPVIPVAKVTLTGIFTILGPPKAIFEVSEQEPGKTPTITKPILREGEREGTVEVLHIDIAKSTVRIRTGTIETNITFEVAKASGPGPGAPGIPAGGAAPPTSLQLPAFGGARNSAANAASSGPTIISPGGADVAGRANTGVAVYGGNNAPHAATPVSATANGASFTSAGLGATALGAGVSAYGATDLSSANLSRPSRIDPAAAANATTPVQRAVAFQTIAADAQQRGLPAVPWPPSAFTRQPAH